MPSTTTCRLGDVLLLEVAYTDLRGAKRRPAVVVSNDEYNETGADAVIVPLTASATRLRMGDYQITGWSSAGLMRPSVARARPTTVARNRIERRLGRLAAADLAGVLAGLRAILG